MYQLKFTFADWQEKEQRVILSVTGLPGTELVGGNLLFSIRNRMQVCSRVKDRIQHLPGSPGADVYEGTSLSVARTVQANHGLINLTLFRIYYFDSKEKHALSTFHDRCQLLQDRTLLLVY